MRQPDARPLVSVVIPVFNRTASLVGAIQSVQAQTLADWELMIVDDGSSEPLDLLVKTIDDPRIRLLRHSSNRGVSAARNTGMDAANGQLVAFLDSDDEWLPGKLLAQSRLIAQQPSPQNVICVTRTIVKQNDAQGLVLPLVPPKPEQSIAEFLYVEDGGFAQVSSFCLSLELARRVRFHEDLRQYEDHLFLIAAMAAGAQYVLEPDALAIWRDDDRADRLGASDSLISGREFLRIADPLLSRRARAAFEARCLGPQLWRENSAKALATFYGAHRAGGLSWTQAARLLVRCWLPDPWLRKVKNLSYRRSSKV